MSCGGPPVVGDYHLGGSQCQGWTLISQGATGPVGGFGSQTCADSGSSDIRNPVYTVRVVSEVLER